MIKKLTAGLTKEEKSWIMCDWASQGYVMIVHTVLFSMFFIHSAAPALYGGAVRANVILGYANTVGTILVGVLAPVLGTLSGYKGIKKLIFTIYPKGLS